MTDAVRVVCSMATAHLLGDLAASYGRDHEPASIESIGGVDAMARIRAGEAWDVVVLAADAIDKLESEGHVVAGSRLDIARAGIAVAVAKDAPAPDISSEESVKRAVGAAAAVGYSTGPSGVHLARVFDRWGTRPRLVQAPPGVAVGDLIARGEVSLGFQQLSELIHIADVRIAGMLPPDMQAMTTFSGGVCARTSRLKSARALLAYFAWNDHDETRKRHGLEPASPTAA